MRPVSGFLVTNETRMLCDDFSSEDYLTRALADAMSVGKMPAASRVESGWGLDSLVAIETLALNCDAYDCFYS